MSKFLLTILASLLFSVGALASDSSGSEIEVAEHDAKPAAQEVNKFPTPASDSAPVFYSEPDDDDDSDGEGEGEEE